MRGEADFGRHRSGEADRSSPLSLHQRNGVFANQHRPEQIHVDQRVKIVQRQVGDPLGAQHSGVGVDGIQAAKVANGQLDRGLDVGLAADVAVLKQAGVSPLAKPAGQRLAGLILNRGRDHASAALGKPLGRRLADAGGSAGNQNHFARETHEGFS